MSSGESVDEQQLMEQVQAMRGQEIMQEFFQVGESRQPLQTAYHSIPHERVADASIVSAADCQGQVLREMRHETF